MGLLSTAGKLLFGNDGGGNFVAYDAATGNPLWHAGLAHNTTNGPQTFLLDGRQYVVVGAGDQLFAFTLAAVATAAEAPCTHGASSER